MPNHIITELQAPAEVIQQLLNDNGVLDFEMIIPVPDNIERGGCSSTNPKSIDANGDIYHPLTNEVCWYDWNRKHFGTKWNGYEQVYDGGGIIQFQTAWSHPTPVIQALSAKNPEAIIQVRYADEDTGSNVATYWAKNGEQFDFHDLDDTAEGYDLACELHYGKTFAEYMAQQVSEDREYYAEEALVRGREGFYWDAVRIALAVGVATVEVPERW